MARRAASHTAASSAARAVSEPFICECQWVGLVALLISIGRPGYVINNEACDDNEEGDKVEDGQLRLPVGARSGEHVRIGTRLGLVLGFNSCLEENQRRKNRPEVRREKAV